ncbi:MAG: isoprenylcysteine carboxylmethyltransferase family protein [Anaerolineales bacterium]|nr:isoprenylcysteine carboxylmethyltransferase family protein [Anaerolineales bacterium]
MDKDNQEMKKGIIHWAIKGVLYKAYVAGVLMFAAGRLDWLAGWLYVVIFLAFDLATALVVIPISPDLLIERSRSNEDAKSWDKIIMPLAAGIFPLVGWILAGFNVRWGWTPAVGNGLRMAGLVGTVLGHGIVVWAMSTNAFFSLLVRIQKERGHVVSAAGPYRFLRHPGYVGAILFSSALPFLLGSWWALIPGILSVILYVLRTWLEDQTLQEELEGYKEYASQVKFRLIPGVW